MAAAMVAAMTSHTAAQQPGEARIRELIRLAAERVASGQTGHHGGCALDDVKNALRHYAERFNGPVGFFESDDMENWNYVFPASQGAQARKNDYFFRNGIGHGKYDDRMPGVVFNGSYTEEAHRARFSRWLAFMEANSWDDLYPVNKTANHRIW